MEYKLKNNTDTSEYAEVTPLYEQKLYDKCVMEHHSLVNNENLRCLWRKKIKSIGVKPEVKVKSPGQLPDFIRDSHFHNQDSKLMPCQSLRNRPPANFVLSAGPGIDKYGYKPIPADMTMKRYRKDNKSDKSSAALKRRIQTTLE